MQRQRQDHTHSRNRWFVRVLPDVVAFGVVLMMAYLLHWEIRDLVWSLWLSSLAVGYLTLMAALCGNAYSGYHFISHETFNQQRRTPAILTGIAMGLFLLGFFSFHFAGFHAAHSVFLQKFFPIAQVPDEGFSAAFTNPLLLWCLAIKYLLTPYGLFLIPAIIAERKHIMLPLMRAFKTVQLLHSSQAPVQEKAPTKLTVGEAMGRPYRNVIRMHLLIIYFALSDLMGIDSFLIYTVIYFVYFFPYGEVKELLKQRAEAKYK